MKGWMLVLLLAVLVGVLFYAQTYLQSIVPSAGLLSQDKQSGNAKAFLTKNNEYLLQYQSEEWGFSLRYPVGYELTSDETFVLKIRGFLPDFPPEEFTVHLEQQASSEQDLQDAVSKLVSATSTTGSITTFSGKKAYFLKDASNDGISASFLYSCTAPNSTAYTAVFTSFVPSAFPEDVETANFIAHSFDC